MKKRIKVGKEVERTVVVFNTYELTSEQNACPECNRQLKEYDIARLTANSTISCPKCGAKLKRK